MSELPKQYDPTKHEPAIYKKWEESDAFKPNGGKPFKRKDKKPFSIMLPLPNVTGSLHMGHALQHTIMDALIRYHRMKGDPTLWQPGTDHAGIATQNVVEKNLREQNISRHDLGREKFIEKVWEWREKSGNEIVSQMKRMGSSCDWSRSVFTMDEEYAAAVQEAFVRYFEQGFIYRGNRIVNWCPRCASVISDLEINRVDQEGELYTLQYPFADDSGSIKVATTRPETMLGDTAVAVHPEDKRYMELIGKEVKLPLVERLIPVIADERIDKEFGTGAVKVTPAHDPLDADIGATHKLKAINVIGEDGNMTELAEEFAGQSVKEARQNILEALEAQKLLLKTESHKHAMTLCDRCDTPIEPLISRQWFADMGKLKGETIEVAEKEVVEFFPTRWKKNFLDWMNDVYDWTISRQLWWGQRIPVWWKAGTHGTEQEEGSYVVSIEKPDGEGWEQDPDVFDTWFSSALWPLVTLGWPKNTKDLEAFYPTSVLITARDILYLWVARMVFSGLNFMKDEKYGDREQKERIPFEHVFIHPTVLTKTGQRMSKSLGTGIDPLGLIDQYGADATRFGLIFHMAYDNQAIKFDEENIKAARNFGNKLWNIARFLDSLDEQEEETVADAWIQYRLNETIVAVTEYLEQYKVGEATQKLYEFIWHDYADWYIEILKEQGSTVVAQSVFKQTLALLHPFMPHITELLWSYEESDSMLITSEWPESSKLTEKQEESVKEVMVFQAQVMAIRSARTLVGISPGDVVEIYVDNPELLPAALQKMCRATIVTENDPKRENALTIPVDGGNDVIMYSDSITKETLKLAEKKIDGEITKLEALIVKQEETLSRMKGKAPEESVTAKEKDITNMQTTVKELKNNRDLLERKS
jgi:valyl-tRNA synthetase